MVEWHTCGGESPLVSARGADPPGPARALEGRAVPGLHARCRVVRRGAGHRDILGGGDGQAGPQHSQGGGRRPDRDGDPGSPGRRRSDRLRSRGGPQAGRAAWPRAHPRGPDDPRRRERQGWGGKVHRRHQPGAGPGRARNADGTPGRGRLRPQRPAHAGHRREGPRRRRAAAPAHREPRSFGDLDGHVRGR